MATSNVLWGSGDAGIEHKDKDLKGKKKTHPVI